MDFASLRPVPMALRPPLSVEVPVFAMSRVFAGEERENRKMPAYLGAGEVGGDGRIGKVFGGENLAFCTRQALTSRAVKH